MIGGHIRPLCLISYHIVNNLGWQPLQEITKIRRLVQGSTIKGRLKNNQTPQKVRFNPYKLDLTQLRLHFTHVRSDLTDRRSDLTHVRSDLTHRRSDSNYATSSKMANNIFKSKIDTNFIVFSFCCKSLS